MRVDAFHFELPEELIAQHPTAERGASRMLLLDRVTGTVEDRTVRELPVLLRPGDLLVLNDTRVLPARLYATRAGVATQAGSPAPSGRVEVLLTHPQRNEAGHNEWNALVRPAKKIVPGERLLFAGTDGAAEPRLQAEVLAAGAFGERLLRFAPTRDFTGALEQIGHMPLPPYIRRTAGEPDRAEDRERYQTVYSRREERERSAAAPTAGLHLTEAILDELRTRGVEIASMTLHVGLGTFQPVRVADTVEIRLHAERYTLPPATAEALNRARHEGRRVVAVGTTTTRTLEHCALQTEQSGSGSGELMPGSGETSLFLSPGTPFRLVSGLMTNFHLPESTLLMLVSAFAGREAVLAAYAHAVRERYRFFSYGDCMLIL